MPHCILEYSANIVDRPDMTRLFIDIHDALMATGVFTRTAIKSRAIRHAVYFIGDGDSERAFITLNVQILEGRSDHVKAQITEGAIEVLKRAFPKSLRQRKCNLTVQVSEIHRESYRHYLSA